MTAPSPDTLLRIYLNDHLMGATVGIDVARRSLGSNRGTPLGSFLVELIGELEEDRASLEGVLEALRLPRSKPKAVLAAVAERLGRLKLNGRLVGYSPLSRLVELEGLAVGVEAKAALWRSLQQVAATDDRLAGVDLDRLLARAASQRERLEEHRLAAAARALGSGR